jgi:hypothetical protein
MFPESMKLGMTKDTFGLLAGTVSLLPAGSWELLSAGKFGAESR